MAASIFHNNGKQRAFLDLRRLKPNLGPVFARQIEDRLRRERPRIKKPAGLDIVICTSRPEKQYTETLLEHLGIHDFNVLGRHLGTWRHICKLELIVEHIRLNPEPELLLHLDAPDVLVCGNLHCVVDYFNENPECDLLAGAEKNSAPGSRSTRDLSGPDREFLARIERFESTTYPGPFVHLNAGCFAGRKQALLEIFSEALEARMEWRLESRLHHGDHMYNDDQLVLREMHRQRYPRIQADHENRVFQNLYAVHRPELAIATPLPRGIPLLAAWVSHLAEVTANRLRRFFPRKRSV